MVLVVAKSELLPGRSSPRTCRRRLRKWYRDELVRNPDRRPKWLSVPSGKTRLCAGSCRTWPGLDRFCRPGSRRSHRIGAPVFCIQWLQPVFHFVEWIRRGQDVVDGVRHPSPTHELTAGNYRHARTTSAKPSVSSRGSCGVAPTPTMHTFIGNGFPSARRPKDIGSILKLRSAGTCTKAISFPSGDQCTARPLSALGEGKPSRSRQFDRRSKVEVMQKRSQLRASLY